MNPRLADQPDWHVGHAVTTVVSPDKQTMLVLTSGYNCVYRTDGGAPDPYGTQFNWPDSNEYVFIYDISTRSPNKMTLNKAQTRLHVAADQTDTVEVIDTVEDNFDFATYNRILWQGLMGDRPYPD